MNFFILLTSTFRSNLIAKKIRIRDLLVRSSNMQVLVVLALLEVVLLLSDHLLAEKLLTHRGLLLKGTGLL